MRPRLVVAIAAVAAVAVLLLAIPLALVLRTQYREDELLRLQRDTVAATREVDVTNARGDPIELPSSSDVLAVYESAGQRVAGEGPPQAGPLVEAALRSGRLEDATDGGVFTVAVPLLVDERVTGAVLATRSDDEATARVHRSWLAVIALAAAIVALAIAAAWILGRRLASPLERLAAAARKLGDGDFSVRAPRSEIAEADAVAAALDATAERLDDLLRRERSFSADASHQLRTPLAAARLELEALELRGTPPEEVGRALVEIERLQLTIDTLLAVARDSDRQPETTDIRLLSCRAEDRWRGPLADQGRPLRTALEAGPLAAKASPGVVAEILDVLLDNAQRHGAGAVTITARRTGGGLAIDVADEGDGFAGDPESAFSRRSGPGHGIGLDLARSLAMAEGGQILVTRAGPRPVLTLLLPVAT